MTTYNQPLETLGNKELRELYKICNSRETQDKILGLLMSRPRDEYKHGSPMVTVGNVKNMLIVNNPNVTQSCTQREIELIFKSLQHETEVHPEHYGDYATWMTNNG